MSSDKTNVMRILDKAKIRYQVHEYPVDDGMIDAVHSAQKMGLAPEQVYKTLVTRGPLHDFYVFVIPAAEKLDLKAAARAVGVKSVSMLHVAELLGLTGYIRGGCSPIGMKKQFRTVVDASAMARETIIFSAGKIGHMVELAPQELLTLIRASAAPICMPHGTAAAESEQG